MELTVNEIATYLGVSEKFVYWMIENENIPVQKKDKKLVFPRMEILEWLKDREIRRNFNENHPEAISFKPFPSFKKTLEQGGGISFLRGSDLVAILYSMVLQMKIPVNEDLGFLFGLLMKEIKNVKFAIGEGMAVLHFQYPLVWPEIPPAVYIGFLAQSIDFLPPSEKFVGTLFCLMSPTQRIQRHLYSRLSWLLRQPAVRDAILDRKPNELILKEIEKAEKGLS